MIPDVSKSLVWLENNHHILTGICRGVERETLRITADGRLSKELFPRNIGSALTHKWITTDFAEALLEFVTPVNKSIDNMLDFLHDLHVYTAKQINGDLLWPFSMPCFVDNEDDIILAQYGCSNIGQMKTVYRSGLKARYGAMMQTIAGVHYNFSLPTEFWQKKSGNKESCDAKQISRGYFQLIRNYLRFGWVIPYLFGASPVLCPSFIQDPEKRKAYRKTVNEKGEYFPYATSLRMSDLGYSNDTQSQLNITFNELTTYVDGILRATKLKSEKFSKLGIFSNGIRQQLNDHVLQIENEFYAQIRPKNVPQGYETPSQALLNHGVQYVEVRTLDVNPFSDVGISKEQILFLDLFLIWCSLANAPEMSSEEMACNKKNWERIVLEGRKPGQTVGLGCDSVRKPLVEVGGRLFEDLMRVAKVLDSETGKKDYGNVIEQFGRCFSEPELTISGKMVQIMRTQKINHFGLTLAKQYKEQLLSSSYRVLTESDFHQEQTRSLLAQKTLEADNALSFEEYLDKYINH